MHCSLGMIVLPFVTLHVLDFAAYKIWWIRVCFPSADLTVQFNPAMYDVSESNGSVTLLLETDKQFQYPFTVNVGTADGTAVGEPHCVDLQNCNMLVNSSS